MFNTKCIIISLIITFTVGCSHREHKNPYDPDAPNYIGNPGGGGQTGTAELKIQSVTIQDANGVQITNPKPYDKLYFYITVKNIGTATYNEIASASLKTDDPYIDYSNKGKNTYSNYYGWTGLDGLGDLIVGSGQEIKPDGTYTVKSEGGQLPFDVKSNAPSGHQVTFKFGVGNKVTDINGSGLKWIQTFLITIQ